MYFFEDDFFYYLKIAQNLAHGAGSTFNGIVTTNGYHPLWLSILTLLSALTTSTRTLFFELALISFLSVLATFFLSRAILRTIGLETVVTTCLAVLVTAYSLPMLLRGMEVTLTIPLALLVIYMSLDLSRWTRSFLSATLVGLAVAVLVLSRLDSIFLVTLIFFALLLTRQLQKHLPWPIVFAMLLGASPLALYILSNRLLFGTFMPVSGMAKQLKSNL